MNHNAQNIPIFPSNNILVHAGMTLRDYHANGALIGILAGSPAYVSKGMNKQTVEDDVRRFRESVANASYAFADAMLKAREVKE